MQTQDGHTVRGRDGQPRLMRCVREIARRELRGKIVFEVIDYAIGEPSVRFSRCASLEEATSRYHTAPNPICLK
ncbi:MAG: hypothetical protein JNJ46_31805 [Myxococcales bacterium]|nr:hypothetical protein [Myxococcales bacterium]